MTDLDVSFLDTANGGRIAYRQRPGARPTILFLSGYASDMEGTKAEMLDGFAAQRGHGYVRFDYSGCGSSDGEFAQGTLEGWLADSLAVVDRLTEGPLLLVGSSMGGWLALLIALARPERIAALVGLAAAPDFTHWGVTGEEERKLIDQGRFERPEPDGGTFVMHRAFHDSAEKLRLLHQPIAIGVPVRLIHGLLDDAVPVDIALQLTGQLGSADVQLLLIKGAGHRLSEPASLDAIRDTLRRLLEPFA